MNSLETEESGTGSLRKPLVIGGLVVALLAGLAGLGVAGWRFYGQSRWPLPPPDGHRSQSGSFSAYLCGKDLDVWPNCRNRSATARDRHAIEVALRTLPQVRDFHFESKEQAFEDFRKGLSDDPAGLKAQSVTGADDMPESYTGTLGPGDWNEVRRRLEALPGVSNVYVFGDSLWWGVVDIGIMFCPDRGDDSAPCGGRTRASEEEKAAVLDRIKGLDGVEAVYFEDAAHALVNRRRVLWDTDVRNVDLRTLPEAFYVTFGKPPAEAEMDKVFGRMPGVAEVVALS